MNHHLLVSAVNYSRHTAWEWQNWTWNKIIAKNMQNNGGHSLFSTMY